MNRKLVLPLVLAIAALIIMVLTIIILRVTGYGMGEGGMTRQEYYQQIPLHPSQLTVEAIENAVAVRWLGTGADDITYQIYRKTSSDTEWQWLNNVELVGDNMGKYEFIDTTIKPGTSYIYGVRAVAVYGKESDMSESEVIIP